MDQKAGYKKTKIGWIPEDWIAKALNTVVTSHNAGIYKKKKLFGEGVNIIGVSNLYNINSVDGQLFRKVPLTEEEKKQYLLQKNDIIYSESSLVREGIGKTVFVKERGVGTAFAWHTRRYKVDTNRISPSFLYYYMNSTNARKRIVAVSTQTALTGITVKDYFSVLIPLPPLPEQKKIASILTTVDAKISSIENKIQQTEQLKKGLMEKLLTEGIGHTDFKATKIGSMPKGWDVERLGEFIDIKSGFGFKLAEYVKDGIPLLKIDNVSWGEITWENVSYLPNYYIEKHPELVLKENDILLALNRPITQNKLKMGILKKEDTPAILYQRVGKIVFQNELIIHKFTYYLLNHILVPFIVKNAVGSDQPFINITALRKLLFQLPPLEEQKQIASILSTVDEKIEVLSKKKHQYQTLKKGLSQQLLTGQMRVKV